MRKFSNVTICADEHERFCMNANRIPVPKLVGAETQAGRDSNGSNWTGIGDTEPMAMQTPERGSMTPHQSNAYLFPQLTICLMFENL